MIHVMVSRQHLEARVLDLVDQVLAGGRLEDDLVECKADWPEPVRAARRIAAHANAAHGQDILWLIGIDEDAHAAAGVSDVDPASWWGQVAKRFDELPPELEHLSVPIGSGRTVVALTFATNRAPYLVTTDGAGGVQREVPYRTATATRSIHRRELLRILVPVTELPSVQVVDARVYMTRESAQEANRTYREPGKPDRFSVQVSGRAFFDASSTAMLPSHLYGLTLAFGAGPDAPMVSLSPFFHHNAWGMAGQSRREEPHPLGVDTHTGGVYISGPGTLEFRAECEKPTAETPLLHRAQRLALRFKFGVAGSDRTIEATSLLYREPQPEQDGGSAPRRRSWRWVTREPSG